jgi:hypothetical protein
MRKLVFAAVVGLLALPLFAQEHVSRFELSQDFVKHWSDEPLRDATVKVLGAGPVHPAATDCEIHVGAEFSDSAFTDFPGVVVEPPNLCHFTGNWRKNIDAAADGEECVARGFMRAWPEHLTNGKPPSNPPHVLEMHPATELHCGSKSFDFLPKLKAFADLGFKTPDTVNKMMDMNVWVCRGCGSSNDPSMLSFDYCFGDPCKAGQASNFARMKATIIRSTIRPESGKELDGVATAIARIRPKGATPNGRLRPLKLYAVKGTKFYDDLIAERDKSGADPSFEIIGIFTLDPFSIKRTYEGKKFEDETWTPVMHPVSLIVFGSL